MERNIKIIMSKDIEKGMHVSFFVGYNASANGIADATVESITEHLITLHVVTENDEWCDTITKKEFDENMWWVARVCRKAC